MTPAPTTYSLWFMPQGEHYRWLAQVIGRFSQAWGTTRFEPHVTLLGGLAGPEEEVISQTVRLAGSLQPIIIQLTSLAGTDEYFRCLFIRVEPTEEVLAAHQQAREVFNQPDEPQYMPHLSLLYHDCPEQVRNAIIAKIGGLFQGEFIAHDLHLYDTTAAPDTWRRVRTFSLC